MVATICWTYNQAKYIEDTLSGFAIQQTNFPVVYIIIDDASTDGERDVLNRWAKQNLNLDNKKESCLQTYYGELVYGRHKSNANALYSILLLAENHYQKGKGKGKYIAEWIENTKYIAICEGDDYWTDPMKLQKQFNFLEKHNNCVLCQHAAQMLYPDNSIKENRRYNETLEKCPPDSIIKGGAGITCSNFFRAELFGIRPDWRTKAPVGDIPLVLIALNVGDVGYINEIMSCYRVSSIGSWTNRKGNGLKNNLKHYNRIILMYQNYNIWSDKRFDSSIKAKIREVRKNRILLFLSRLKRIIFN